MLKVITQPTAEPLSIAEVRRYVRQFGTASDDLLNDLIRQMRAAGEAFQNRAYLAQTLEVSFDTLQHEYQLPRPPLQEVLSITIRDTYGVTFAMSTASFVYDTIKEPGIMKLRPDSSWPAANVDAVVVRYRAGYADTASVPENTKLGLKAAIVNAWDNPGEAELCRAAISLLGYDRVMSI